MCGIRSILNHSNEFKSIIYFKKRSVLTNKIINHLGMYISIMPRIIIEANNYL